MKELKKTKPLWAKRNSHLVDNCMKSRKQKAGRATHLCKGGRLAGICAGSSPVPCIHK